jgi:preprotein translocase subunit YajC
MSLLPLLPLAQAAAPAAGGQQSGVFMIGWLVLMIVIFYFLLIRPQKRRDAERRKLLSSLQSGTKVIFSGGILGTIANVKEKTLVVRVADGVKVEILRAAVLQVLSGDEKPDDAAVENASR